MIVNQKYCAFCGSKRISILADCCDGNGNELEHYRCKRCRKEWYIRVIELDKNASKILYDYLRKKE